MKKIAIFHTGKKNYKSNRVKTFVKFADCFNAEYFGVHIYFTFPNIGEFESVINTDVYEFFTQHMGCDIPDAACKWDDLRDDFDRVMNELELDFDSDMLGEPIVTGDSGNELCTLEEYNSDNGRLNIDEDFDSYYWQPVEDLDVDDLELIIDDSLGFYELMYLIDNDISAKLLSILDADHELIAECIYNNWSIDDLIRLSFIEKKEDGEYILA